MKPRFVIAFGVGLVLSLAFVRAHPDAIRHRQPARGKPATSFLTSHSAMPLHPSGCWRSTSPSGRQDLRFCPTN